MADEVLQLLCSAAKLDREKGVRELERLLNQSDQCTIISLTSSIETLLKNQESEWESKHGGLMGAKCMLLSSKYEDDNVNFQQNTLVSSLLLLEDSESRVRLAAGEVMGVLCHTVGSKVYADCKERVLNGIRDNLERKPVSELDEKTQKEAANLSEKLSIDDFELRRTTSAEQIFHDTAGWKSLETWMKCLQFMIEGCGSRFNTFIDQELLDLIVSTLTHTNRFVRETGYYVCAALVGCNYSTDGTVLVPLEENMIYVHGKQFADHLGAGLADNWSQVRLAASTAARSFLIGLKDNDARSQFYSVLLPPLCLNRYYVAEGVRIYNQQTWKEVTAGQGKELVEQYIDNMVTFYVSQSEADNHAVREAACACIAELGSKVEKDVVRPHIPKLLDALYACFQDDSWPVRDASCVACGNFILCFPDESKYSMSNLYPLFFQNLEDNIPSVREGAAIALANVVSAYKEEIWDGVLEKVRAGLEGIEKQEANVDKYSAMEKGPATYGVVKRLRDNDMDIHENNPMYSCGSLAPKMGRGKRGGGCMDHQFKRPSEPWELGDGCIHLVAELSKIEFCSKEVTKLLPLLAKASNHKHYTQHLSLLETLCKRLPVICNGLGKKVFKMYLEMYFDSIFYALGCDNQLTSNAASQCLVEFGASLGPNILRGRVEQHDPRYLESLPPMGPGPGPGMPGMHPGMMGAGFPGGMSAGMPGASMPPGMHPGISGAGFAGGRGTGIPGTSMAPWATQGLNKDLPVPGSSVLNNKPTKQ